MSYLKNKQSGFFLIEVVVASALVATILISLLTSIQSTVEVSQRSLEKTQAGYLLEEGVESVKVIRDSAWSNIASLTNGTTYYLVWSGSSWSLTTTPSSVGMFTRTIVFQAVNRDSNDDIVDTGGTLDTRIKKVTASASWTTPSGSKSEDIVFYISDIRT